MADMILHELSCGEFWWVFWWGGQTGSFGSLEGGANLHPVVRSKLEMLFAGGRLRRDEIAGAILDSLAQFDLQTGSQVAAPSLPLTAYVCAQLWSLQESTTRPLPSCSMLCCA